MLKNEIRELKDNHAKQYKKLAECKRKIAAFENEQFPPEQSEESGVLHRSNSNKSQASGGNRGFQSSLDKTEGTEMHKVKHDPENTENECHVGDVLEEDGRIGEIESELGPGLQDMGSGEE